jgi:hypothetical protein
MIFGVAFCAELRFAIVFSIFFSIFIVNAGFFKTFSPFLA